MENAQPTLRFAIAGTGYVGLSLACLLASVGDVRALDVVPEKVEKINSGISPIADTEIEKVLASRPATLQATLDANYAFENRGFIVIATPTNYDPDRNTFDTSSIETVLDEVKASGSTATVVIKSTIPVGYTERISQQYSELDILFSPEFLREGHALADNLRPLTHRGWRSQNREREQARTSGEGLPCLCGGPQSRCQRRSSRHHSRAHHGRDRG